MGLYRDIVPSSSLRIVPDLHQLTCRWIDEALACLLPGTTRREGRTVAPPLEEDGREHHRAVDEEVQDQPSHDPRERERDGANDGEHTIGKDRLSQHGTQPLSGSTTAAVP